MDKLRDLGAEFRKSCWDMCELLDFATEEEQKTKLEYLELKEKILGYVWFNIRIPVSQILFLYSVCIHDAHIHKPKN